ncbi:MAG: hypothetical protein QOF84_3264 [Streptomyces sp.]|nr:hypothetical protein [Streptomyces sp.]
MVVHRLGGAFGIAGLQPFVDEAVLGVGVLTVLDGGLADVAKTAERLGVDGAHHRAAEPVAGRDHDRVVELQVGAQQPGGVGLLGEQQGERRLDAP